jgi:hypothetical protein
MWMTVIRTCVLLAALDRAASADSGAASHVRSTDLRVGTLIAQGAVRSPLLQSLIHQLDQSDVFVYVEHAVLPSGLTGRLTFTTSSGRWRYLRIQIDCRQSLTSQTVALGHELRHAVEIANAAVVDEASVRQLYHVIGFTLDTTERRFESTGAQQTAVQVRRELRTEPLGHRVTEP